MIPNFPKPFQDELFYSWVARYQWSMLDANYARMMRMLFGGHPNSCLSTDLPARLNNFVSNVGSPALNSDEIIRRHTLLPANAPFMPLSRLQSVTSGMKNTRSGALLLRGTGVLSVTPPASLQFCPLCSLEERKTRGEAYWHRLHQLVGVMVCPVHNVFLEASSAPYRGQFRLYAAESVIAEVDPRPIDGCNPDHSLLQRISLGGAWLLENWSGEKDFYWLCGRYRQLALKHGFITNSGRILWNKLSSAFEQRYSNGVLDFLQCRLSDNPSVREANWVVHILGGVNYVQAPVRHLLLMDLFGVKVSDFFDPQSEQTLLGTAARECDNPVCPKHGQSVVSVTYKYDPRMKGARAHLSCPVCGKERLEGRSPGRGRIHVKTYGPIWDSKLREFVNDRSLPLQAIPRMLGVKARVFRQEAARLGSSMPCEGAACADGKSWPRPRTRDNARFQRKRIEMEELWLSIRNQRPSASRSELRLAYRRYYNWLRRNDRDWFELNTPPRITVTPPMIRKRREGDDGRSE